MLTISGVLLNISMCGVLLTGKENIGKSSLALHLLSRGHQLIADDIVECSVTNNSLQGTCPALAHGFLFVRALGMLNIEKLYGAGSITSTTTIQLIINLNDKDSTNQQEILGVTVPQINLIHKTAADSAILIEVLVKNFKLQQQNYDATADFAWRQAKLLQQGEQNRER